MGERKDPVVPQNNGSVGDADERELERAFAALDAITASDALKEKTLAAIFAQMDDEDARPKTSGDKTREANAPELRVFEGGARPTSAGKAARRRRPRVRQIRIAAALVAAALVLGGGTAYALPATHVLATSGETTFDLGVNVFGITVSASADTDEGKAALEGANVRNKRFEDAFDSVLEAYGKQVEQESEAVRVEVSGSFVGSGDRVLDQANGVVETRAKRLEQGQREQSQSEQGQEPASSGATEGVNPPVEQAPEQRSEQPAEQPQASTPVQEGAGSPQGQQPDSFADAAFEPQGMPDSRGVAANEPGQAPPA